MSHDLKSKLIQKNNPDSNPDSNTGKDDNSIVNYDVIGKNDFIIFTRVLVNEWVAKTHLLKWVSQANNHTPKT